MARIGIPEAAVRALIAGNDLLCFGGDLVRAPGPVAESLIEATAAAIVEAVRDGRLTAERLDEAATRNAFLGTTPPTERVNGHDPGLGLAAARRALRVEGTLPGSGGLVVQLEPPATIAVGEVPWGLAPYLTGVLTFHVPVNPTLSTVDSAAATASEIAAGAAGRPLVVVSRDTHRHPWARQVVELVSTRHPAVVLVEMGWPAAWRPAGAVAYVASYGAAEANARAVAEALNTPRS